MTSYSVGHWHGSRCSFLLAEGRDLCLCGAERFIGRLAL